MTYKPKQGETWDEVSYKVYGTDEFTHILLKANLDKSDILIFSGNETLDIPDVPEEVRLLTEACIETLFCTLKLDFLLSSPPHGGVY